MNKLFLIMVFMVFTLIYAVVNERIGYLQYQSRSIAEYEALRGEFHGLQRTRGYVDNAYTCVLKKGINNE